MIYYLRDSNSKLIGLKYNNNLYYYLKNIQDDIIGLLDSNYNLVAQYLYDSWGNIISIKDNSGNEITDTSNIAHINPYRYRSYYYDKDTKLYYLNSRYYNPAWGRFINADGIINADDWILGNNLYPYCKNNPIIFSDDLGTGILSKIFGTFTELLSPQLQLINFGISRVTSLFAPNASDMIKDSIMGNGLMSKKTEERLIEDIKDSDLFHSILAENKPGVMFEKDYSSGSAAFTGFTDLRLGVGRFNYELFWERSKISINNPINNKETWEVRVRIWDAYNFDESTSDYKSAIGALNSYGLTMQNAGVFKPYYWELNFIYVYIVD